MITDGIYRQSRLRLAQMTDADIRTEALSRIVPPGYVPQSYAPFGAEFVRRIEEEIEREAQHLRRMRETARQNERRRTRNFVMWTMTAYALGFMTALAMIAWAKMVQS